MAIPPAPSPAQIVDRLAEHSDRLHSGSIVRARALWSIWNSYNSPENPLREDGLRFNRSSVVLNQLAQAALHETIMILVRALDGAGRYGAFRTNRVSFTVMAELIEVPGVRDEIEHRARNWLPDGWLADENAAGSRAALNLLIHGVNRLATEQPNRHKRLRDYRDEFLAHNLAFEEERERPIFGDITGLLTEITELSDQAQLAFRGANVVWEPFGEDMGARSGELWDLIRSGVEAREQR